MSMRSMRFGGSPLPGTPGRTWAVIAIKYFFAVIAVAVAVVLRWRLEAAFGPLPMFVTFYPAVLLVASIGGGGPGIFATLLSALVADYWFILPYGFGIAAPNDILAMGIFTGTSLFLCILAERLSRARWAEAVSVAQAQQLEELTRLNEELSQQTEELSQQSEELAQQNEELQTQSEEIQTLNVELGHREDVLQKILDAARRASSEEEAMQEICVAALGMFGEAVVAAAVYEQQAERLLILATAGLGDGSGVPPWRVAAQSFPNLVIQENRTACLNDTSLRPDLSILEVQGQERFQAVLGAPMRTTDQAFGVVVLYSHQPLEWTAEQFRLVEWLASQCSRILETLRLQVQLRRQAALIDLSPDAIIVRRLDGTITFWSNGAETLYGWTKDEAVGRQTDVIFRTQLPEPLEQIDEELKRTGRWSGKLIHHAKDGRKVVVQSWWMAQLDAQGEVTELFESNVDITQRKQADEQLKAVNETLEQRVAERTAEAERRAAQLRAMASDIIQTEQRERRLLAKVLHDNLQQSLVAARLKIGLLRRRTKADEAITRMVDEVNGLIDESIAESRSLTMELSPPVLYDAGLEAGLAWLSRRMKDKHGLTVEVVVDPAADPKDENLRIFLFEAARELLFNVVKHAQVQQAQVILAKNNKGKLRIEVRDNGVGCNTEQLINSTNEGEGFGLFSLRERLELLGGLMEIESAPGKGMRIAVEVPPIEPLASASPPITSPGDAPAPTAVVRGRGGLRVLLADDHPIVRKGLIDTLREQAGIEAVFEARDGQEAVELALQTRPNVVLLDVAMPRLNGVEAARQIKALMPEVRIIGLSMHQSGDMAQAMIEAGADKYIRKDVPSEVLIAAIFNEPGCT